MLSALPQIHPQPHQGVPAPCTLLYTPCPLPWHPSPARSLGVSGSTVSPQGASPAQAEAAAPQAWGQHEAPRRVKRAWVIPPISVSENHKRIPHLLVQVGESPPASLAEWGHPGQGDCTGAPQRGSDPSLGPPALIFLRQIKSDKQQPGGVIYSIKGPGVDEEPLGIFSIDKFSGKVFLNAMLDREEHDRYRVRTALGAHGPSLGAQADPDPHCAPTAQSLRSGPGRGHPGGAHGPGDHRGGPERQPAAVPAGRVHREGGGGG